MSTSLFRRAAVAGIAALLTTTGLAAAPSSAAPATTAAAVAAPGVDYTEQVNPFMSTEDDFGQNIPGAYVPNGLVKANPMTAPGRSHTGYDYAESQINGFTLTNLDGAGGSGGGGDVLVVPTYRSYDARPGTGTYAKAYSHDDETAEPGYYQVGLETDQGTIDARMTTDVRSAVEQFTFPAAGEASLVVDLRNNYTQRVSSSLDVTTLDDGRAAVSGDVVGSFNGYRYRLYYYAETSVPVTDVRTWTDGGALAGTRHRSGTDTGAILTFDVAAGQEVELRATMSPISVDQARRDQQVELGGRSFEDVRTAAHDSWQDKLGQVAVTATETSDPDGSLSEIFYTSLYRMLATPVNATSTDGTYRGVDGRVHRADGYTHYDSWYTWDDFRKFSVIAYLYPDVYDDMAQSLVDLYADAASSGTSLNNAMHAVPTCRFERSAIIIADAVSKGVRLDRLAEAYPAIASTENTYNSANEARGYHADDPGNTVGTSYDDYAMSVLADEVGRAQDATRYRTRAGNYQNLIKPGAWTADDGTQVGVLSPRDATGTWTPADLEQFEAARLYQGTLWQHNWYPAHDMAGLIDAMGGNAAAQKALSHFFGEQAPDDGTRMLHSNANEIDLQSPYLFNYVGQPWKTQRWVRDIYTKETWQRYIATGSTHEWPSSGGELRPPVKTKVYQSQPQGFLPTMDDDAGTMSTMFVAAAVGLFPVTAGSSEYQLGSPFFDQVEVSYADGGSFTVNADGVSPDDYYVQSATLDGRPFGNTWLDYDDIVDGGSLDLAMGSEQSTWGADSDPAFSLSEGDGTGPVGGVDDALAWSASEFIESADNDGTIGSTVEVEVKGAAYVGQVGDDLTQHITDANVPAGLNLRAVKTGNTTLELSLTGTADAHTAADSVEDLTVRLRDAIFTGGVSSRDKTVTLGVVFRGYNVVSSPTEIKAAADGTVADDITMTVRGGATLAGADGDDFVAAGLAGVAGLPEGVTATVRRSSARTLTVHVEGVLPSQQQVRFAVRLLPGALAGGVDPGDLEGVGLRLRDPFRILVTEHRRAELRSDLDEARLVVQGGYTAASYDAVVAARDTARTVLADPDATDAEIATAQSDLAAALDGLALGEGGFGRLEAEHSHAWSGGSELHNEPTGIGGVRPGAWIAFQGLDYGGEDPPTSVQVRYSGASNDGYANAAVEVRVGAVDGPLVASVPVPPTAPGFGTYATATADLENVEELAGDGPKTVYFVFTGSSDDGQQHWVGNFDWMQFVDDDLGVEQPLLQPANATALHSGIDASNPALFQNVHDSEWAEYAGYDFGTGVDTVTVYYDKPATRTPDQTSVELHLGNRDGEPAAVVPLSTTGSSWGTYATTTIPLEDPGLFTGTKDLSLVFKAPGADGDRPYVANIGHVQLSSTASDQDAYVLEMESFADHSGGGLAVENSTWDDGTSVTNIGGTADGDWLRYADVALTQDVTSLQVHYVNNSSRCGQNSRIDVYLDSREGDPLVSVPLPVTGSAWSNAGTTSISLPTAVRGTHDIYLELHTIADANHPYVANIDSVTFTYGVDKSALRALVAANQPRLAEGGRYVEADFRVFSTTMAAAEEVLADDTAAASDVTAASRKLRLAAGQLAPRAQRGLIATLGDASAIDLAGYTDGTADGLRSRMSAAQDLLDAGSAADEEYAAETARLEDAIAALVARPATVPQPPTAVSATADGRALTVSWAAPAEDGGSPVTGYRVQLDDGEWQEIDDPSTTSHTFRGVERGHEYRARVVALNAQGESAASEYTAYVAIPADVPTPPDRPAASTVGASVTLAWMAPYDGGSAITGYLVRLDDGPAVEVPATATEHTFTGVAPGSHRARVAAVNAVGESSWSEVSNPVEVLARPAVASISVTAPSPTTAQVGWTMTSEEPVVLQVSASRDGSPVVSTLVWSDAGSVDLTGLRAETDYEISVGVFGDDAVVTDTVSTPAQQRVTSAAASITGKPRVGNRLGVSVNRADWTPDVRFTYVWLVKGKRVDTGARLRLKPRYAGKRVVVKVTGHKAGWVSTTVRSKAVRVRR